MSVGTYLKRGSEMMKIGSTLHLLFNVKKGTYNVCYTYKMYATIYLFIFLNVQEFLINKTGSIYLFT